MKNNAELLTKNLLKAVEVAEILNVSKTFVYKILSSGQLRSVKMGSAVRVRQVDLDNYIRNCLSTSNLGRS